MGVISFKDISNCSIESFYYKASDRNYKPSSRIALPLRFK